MAKTATNARIYLAEVDLSGVANACALNMKTDIVDCTAFSDAYKDKLGGFTDVIVDVSGYFDAGTDPDTSGNPDHKMFDQLALSNGVLSIIGGTGAAADTCWFFRPTLTTYNPLEGKVSEMATFKLHGEGAAPLVKGQVMVAKAAKTLTGTSTPYQLGALTATQTLYCAVHVFAASADDTLDLVLQSDAAEAFDSPTSQITFAQITGIGQDWQSKAGAVADTWWRLSYTIGGVAPSFTIAVVAGIV